ncbi:MAG: hypothetical protein LBT42_09030 [Tannerella sp.]|jgi:hypothetical protein|nr:hypothetical protein [Tannerella sp.]
MDRKKYILDELRDRNPFRVPEGYFEGFTEELMCRLPEKPVNEAKEVSLYGRIKPLLYLAAAFAGLIVLFNTLNKTTGDSMDNTQRIVSTTSSTLSDTVEADEDAEFLEYIEDMYADKYAISYIDDFMNNY